MGCEKRIFEALPPAPKKFAQYVWAAMVFKGDRCGITPPTKITMYVGAAMGCSEKTFEELSPDQNCH